MKSSKILVGLSIVVGVLGCQSTAGGSESDRAVELSTAGIDRGQTRHPAPGTRLIVLLVVDQLTPDLLVRYEPAFSGGFRRLMDRGRSYTNVTHDHAHTETSPGHASISTGTFPSRHGMVSNQWWQDVDGRPTQIQNVLHEDHVEVGDSIMGAGAPERLERTGLADWMETSDPAARILSVSGKDRAAVLLAGKSRAPTFWFSRRQGRFVTSTYYANDLPNWVKDFNGSQLLESLERDSLWESTVPRAFAGLSRPDTAMNEGDGIYSWFPHRPQPGPEARRMGRAEWLEFIPHLDRLTLELAKAGVTSLGLGDDVVPDLLAVSVSQTDRVGHAFGPRSREQLDNLIRLDVLLGDFFGFLDEHVGQGAYTVALTSDHGVLELPEYRIEQGLKGRRLTESDKRELEQILTGVARTESFFEPGDLAPSLAKAAPEVDWVERAWPTTALDGGGRIEGAQGDTIEVMFRNSTYPGRGTGAMGRYGVVLQIEEGTLDWAQRLGSTHGSPYYYDRHVPLIFMGPSIQPGSDEARISTVDIAPTLARWAGARTPRDLDGRPVLGVGLPN